MTGVQTCALPILHLQCRAGLIDEWRYESVTLHLARGLRYTPDFLVCVYVGGSRGIAQKIEFREVKGWSKNRRDGLTRLKMAAAHYPWWTFKLVERIGGQWKETIIPA